MKFFAALLLIFFVTGCGGAPSSDHMTPMPGDFRGPPDSVLFEHVAAYVAANGRPANSVYDHVRVDMNADGLDDALVLFKLPHQVWCGWDGCGFVIFEANRESFTPIASMSGVRGPLYILKQRSNGWRDIVMRVSGTRQRDKNVIFKFDGRTYPRHPMLAAGYPVPLTSVEHRRYFR